MDLIPRDARQRTKGHECNARTKRGFVLGAVLMYSDTQFRVSQHTYRHKELAKALCDLGREAFPDFPFTSIMVNKDGCALHVDRNNCGPSMICSLGEHTGGELWQWPGDVIDVHNKFQMSNGLLPHATLPFKGERYSLVYYCVRELRALPSDEDQKLLRDLGFWDLTNRPAKTGRARTDLLKTAAEQLKTFLDPDGSPQTDPQADQAVPQAAGLNAPASLTAVLQPDLSSLLW